MDGKKPMGEKPSNPYAGRHISISADIVQGLDGVHVVYLIECVDGGDQLRITRVDNLFVGIEESDILVWCTAFYLLRIFTTVQDIVVYFAYIGNRNVDIPVVVVEPLQKLEGGRKTA